MLTAPIDISGSGDNTIVAADSTRRIRVHSYVLNGAGAVNARWKSGASTNLSGLIYISALGGGVSSPSCVPTPTEVSACLLATAKGEALVLNLSGAVAVGGHVSYTLDPV